MNIEEYITNLYPNRIIIRVIKQSYGYNFHYRVGSHGLMYHGRIYEKDFNNWLARRDIYI